MIPRGGATRRASVLVVAQAEVVGVFARAAFERLCKLEQVGVLEDHAAWFPDPVARNGLRGDL